MKNVREVLTMTLMSAHQQQVNANHFPPEGQMEIFHEDTSPCFDL